MKLARTLFVLAMLLMPMTSGVKMLAGYRGIWMNPTLILAPLIFLLLRFPVRKRIDVGLLAYTFLSAAIGLLFLTPSVDREKSAAYVAFMEPVRLLLNICWFWVCVWFIRINRRFVLKALAAAVVLEFAIASYLYLAMLGFVSVTGAPALFLAIYKARQSIWFGETPFFRMSGTFFEGPPFGLFMFCCLIALVLGVITGEENLRHAKWFRCSVVAAALGIVLALSDQVLLAVAMVAGGWFLTRARNLSFRYRAAMTIAVLVVLGYAVTQVANKWSIFASTSPGDIFAQSAGERMFHVHYGLGVFLEEPASILTGIGPGRYGDYAVRTGLFPSTVTVQVTVVEWLVEYGLIGVVVLSAWFLSILNPAVPVIGRHAIFILIALITANMFQANWMSEAFFLALAFLYSSTDADERSLPAIAAEMSANRWSAPSVHGANAL